MTDPSILGFFSGAWSLIVAIFFLGASIFVHELGHFLAARRRGLRVERFSIGFGPPIVAWRGKDGVQYRISWLPFGGYVALPQLADMGRLEGADTFDDQAGAPPANPDADETREKQIGYLDKMIVLVMGSVFNLVFAFALSLVLWFTGQEVVSAMLQTRIGTVSETLDAYGLEGVESPAKKAGLQPGDEVVAIDGVPIEDWQDLTYRIVTGLKRDAEGNPVSVFTIRRGDDTFDVEIKPALITREDRRFVGIGPADIFMVGALEPDSPAAAAGFREGDIFRAIDGEPILSYFGMRRQILDSPEQPHRFTVERENGRVDITYQPTRVVDESSGQERLEWGFQPTYKTETIYPNPVVQFAEKMEMFYLTLRALLTPSSDVKVRNMSGPVGIIDNLQMAAQIGIKQAIWFLVFININLAVLNLLPIPVLDGGHMAFATIAKIRGKPLPQRLLESTQAVFVILLFSFMLYVTFFDFGRLKDRFTDDEGAPPATRTSQESGTGGDNPDP